MNLRYQRRLAAQILGVGVHRVKIHADPKSLDDAEISITRNDIREKSRFSQIVGVPVFQKRQKLGTSRGRARHLKRQKSRGKRRGQGSRRGTGGARHPRKATWVRTIRPLRARLREYRASGRIEPSTYRSYYLRAKGGLFKSVAHLELQLRAHGLLKEASP